MKLYYLYTWIHLFWSLRGDNRPRRSVSSEVPIKPYMFYVGPYCWAYIGHGEPCWAYVGPMLGLCWAYIGHGEPCWAYVGPMLGLCWAYVGPMLGLCWAHVGPMLGHVEPRFGNLANLRLLKKTWKTQDSRAIQGTRPKTPRHLRCGQIWWRSGGLHV